MLKLPTINFLVLLTSLVQVGMLLLVLGEIIEMVELTLLMLMVVMVVKERVTDTVVAVVHVPH